jgi:hypothetical protein
MNRKDAIKLWFTIVFLLVIPASVHTLFEGAYVVNPDAYRRTFWIGPVSTTVPYLILTVSFLAHCSMLKSHSRRSAYCGAVAAWLGMMAFTIFLIFQNPGPKHSSTMAIAVGLTPFFYIPVLFFSYILGTILDAFWRHWE